VPSSGIDRRLWPAAAAAAEQRCHLVVVTRRPLDSAPDFSARHDTRGHAPIVPRRRPSHRRHHSDDHIRYARGPKVTHNERGVVIYNSERASSIFVQNVSLHVPVKCILSPPQMKNPPFVRVFRNS